MKNGKDKIEFQMKNKNETPLYERFTFQGFLTVSGWAFTFSIMGLAGFFSLLSRLPFFQKYQISTLEYIFIGYGIVWFFCFLFMCLIPKLKDN